MQKRIVTFNALLAAAIFIALLPCSTLARQDNQKLAQTGLKFLSVGTSARQAALADAFTAADGYSLSTFYNPAGMARLGMVADVSFGQVNWIADIKHTWASVAFSPWSGDYGVIGLSLQLVDYGEVEETILAPIEQGFLELGTFKPTATMVGLSYARSLTDKFSIGGTVKLVNQNLGSGYVEYTDTTNKRIENSLDVVAFDFGVLYRTGFKSLTLGMTVRNFAREVKYQKEGFQLPLTFRLGMSINVLDLFEMDQASQSLLLSVDAEHPRDYPEQIKIGAEYTFMNTVALRVGYVNPADEHGLSYGVGLQHALAGTNFGLDYSYTPFGVFDNVQRLSLRFEF